MLRQRQSEHLEVALLLRVILVLEYAVGVVAGLSGVGIMLGLAKVGGIVGAVASIGALSGRPCHNHKQGA